MLRVVCPTGLRDRTSLLCQHIAKVTFRTSSVQCLGQANGAKQLREWYYVHKLRGGSARTVFGPRHIVVKSNVCLYLPFLCSVLADLCLNLFPTDAMVCAHLRVRWGLYSARCLHPGKAHRYVCRDLLLCYPWSNIRTRSDTTFVAFLLATWWVGCRCGFAGRYLCCITTRYLIWYATLAGEDTRLDA